MTHDAPAATHGPARRLETPAALALADLAAIFEDLQTVLRCCERLVHDLASTDGDADLALEAFWTTALLSYSRCFSAGPRGTGLTPDDVTGTNLPGDVLGWHRVLQQLADHYAGTAANPRETFSVGVFLSAAGQADGIGVTSARQPPVDDLTVRQTGAIALELRRLVDQRIAEQQHVVFGTVAAMTPAQLARLPILDVVVTDSPAPGA